MSPSVGLQASSSSSTQPSRHRMWLQVAFCPLPRLGFFTSLAQVDIGPVVMCRRGDLCVSMWNTCGTR